MDLLRPICYRIAAVYPFNEGAGRPFNLLGSRSAIVTMPGAANAFIWSRSRHGVCINCSLGGSFNTNDFGPPDVDLQLDGTKSFSIFALASVDGGAGVRRNLFTNNGAVNKVLFGVGVIGAGNVAEFQSSLVTVTGVTTVAADKSWHSFAATVKSDSVGSATGPAEMKLYLDGFLDAVTTSAPGAAGATTTDWQTQDAAGNRGWQGNIALIAVWTRALTALEITSLHFNPWQIFQPPTWDRYTQYYLTGAASAGVQPAIINNPVVF